MYALTIQRNVDYVVYKTKGVFKVEKRAVWSMNLKDNREENNAESSQKKFEFCMQRQIVGIGWFPNENFDADPAFCNAKKCLSSFKRGDLVWIKEPAKDVYFIAEITDEKITSTMDNEFAEHDISCYRKCKFFPVGAKEIIPEKYAQYIKRLVTSQTIQPRTNDELICVVNELYLRNTAEEKTIDAGNTTFASDKKSFKQKNKKMIIVIFSIFLCAVAVFFVVKGVQYGKTQNEIATMMEKIQGKTYIYCDYDYYSSIDYDCFKYDVLEFDQDAKKKREYGFTRDLSSADYRIVADFYDWNNISFNIDFFSGKIKYKYYDFKYNERTDTITLNNHNYNVVSEENYETFNQMYKTLFEYMQSENYRQLGDENKADFVNVLDAIESNVPINIEELKAEVYLDSALASLEKQDMHSYSIPELLNACTKNLEYEGVEYDEANNNYIYTYTCDYAPNKADLPNYYVSGDFIIVYNVDNGEAGISGPVASAMNTFAILTAFS